MNCQTEPSVLEVNLSAIDHNVLAVRRLVGADCRLCPIVKADAYGLGAARVARRLATSGADMVAVYSLPQAAELGAATAVAAGLPIPTLVLMPVSEIRRGDETARMLVSGRLHLTVHDAAQLAAIEAIADDFATRVPVHIEVDTGMSRGGARPEDAAKLIERIATGSRCDLKGVFTHFTNSRVDRAATDAQIERFDAMLQACDALIPGECSVHVASTYALFRARRYHRSMVRFGLAWSGFGLDELEAGELELAGDLLRPCLRWRSRVVQVKRIPVGTSVGYGSRWTATRPSVIGLVPVGYADGFPVFRPGAASDGDVQKIAVLRDTPKGIVREYVPVVGAVNMDQITVDLTDVELLGQPNDGVGMTVELITPDAAAPNHLPRLAARSGMIPHEMLCRIHPRIPRMYVVDGVVENALPQAEVRSAPLGGIAAAAG
ncbi:MAG: alanine racemase [Phycisphaerales bacterium]